MRAEAPTHKKTKERMLRMRGRVRVRAGTPTHQKNKRENLEDEGQGEGEGGTPTHKIRKKSIFRMRDRVRAETQTEKKEHLRYG